MKPLKLTDGRVVRPQMRDALPILTGIALADIQVGRRVTSPSIYRALDLLDEFYQSAAASMVELAQIDLSHPRRLRARTRSGAVLEFGTGDFVQELRRLGLILQWAQRRRKQVQTVNLTVAQSVPVTWARGGE